MGKSSLTLTGLLQQAALFTSPFLPSSSAVTTPAQYKEEVPSWHQYVRAPSNTSIVRPKRVLADYTKGNIQNPDGLVTGGEVTVLTRNDADSQDIPTLVVDFGQNVVGQLLIELDGATNGSKAGYPGLRLAFSEALQYLSDRSDYTRSDRAGGDTPKIVYSGTDQVAVKNDPYVWEDIWGCEYDDQVCSDGLHGFRYTRISLDALSEDAPFTSSDGQVRIKSVSLRWSGYLGTPDTFTGWFECSDTDLTQWWYDGVYTADMGTDVFRANDTEPRGARSGSLVGKLVLHDGAKRDRDPYMGDLAVAGLTSYLSHNVSEASFNVLEDLAKHQRASDGWIPPASINGYTLPLFDYPLYWVTCTWDYVFYTGNMSYLNAHYGVMARVLDTYYPAHTDTSKNLLVRQSGYGDYAFLPRDGTVAYYNALYVLALNKAAELADLSSHSADAKRWRQRANATAKAFQKEFWDPSVSAYLDRKCTGCTAHAQDGNSLAIISGITNSSNNSTLATSLLSYLSSSTSRAYGNAFYDLGGESLGEGFSDRVYAFISYFEGAARFQSDDAEGALDMIRRTWGWMAAQDPGVTHWEGIGTDGEKYEAQDTSLAHGWSTGVVPLLTNYVLGVTPTKPGFEGWRVDPVVISSPSDSNDNKGGGKGGAAGGIDWARGTVPTPKGPLAVSWDLDDEGQVVVVVNAPKGTKGVVGGKNSRSKEVQVEGGESRTVTLVRAS